MRLRVTVLACALAALVPAALPSLADAAPQHDRGISIRAVPHAIIAGESVLIYGRLTGPKHANQTITLYHRINPQPSFSVIGATKTDSRGLYEFTRAEGIVESNRSWYVRGPGFTHSSTIHERVAALVSLAASSADGLTRHPITFSGSVTPHHAGGTVLLQAERGNRDDWQTLKRGRIAPGSTYQIPYAWRVPGAHDVRVVFPGDARNTPGVSDPVTVLIQQTQHADFTITSSAPIVPNGSPYTISGTLYQPGTTTPEPSTSVSLFAALPGTGGYHEVTTAMTDSSGNYSFAGLTSSTNHLYQARATFAPVRDGSAVLFEGVQDVVNMSTSSQTSTVGGQVTFTGSVSPGKSGHVIYLQKFGKDGDWHTVEVGTVTAASTFSFSWTFGAAGTKQFRARVTGGPANVGAASPIVTIVVTQPPVTALPSS
ncbi:MAG: hypothetical protein WCB67_15960 [Solirubrobacteraceae bacterium]